MPRRGYGPHARIACAHGRLRPDAKAVAVPADAWSRLRAEVSENGDDVCSPEEGVRPRIAAPDHVPDDDEGGFRTGDKRDDDDGVRVVAEIRGSEPARGCEGPGHAGGTPAPPPRPPPRLSAPEFPAWSSAACAECAAARAETAAEKSERRALVEAHGETCASMLRPAVIDPAVAAASSPSFAPCPALARRLARVRRGVENTRPERRKRSRVRSRVASHAREPRRVARVDGVRARRPRRGFPGLALAAPRSRVRPIVRRDDRDAAMELVPRDVFETLEILLGDAVDAAPRCSVAMDPDAPPGTTPTDVDPGEMRSVRRARRRRRGGTRRSGASGGGVSSGEGQGTEDDPSPGRKRGGNGVGDGDGEVRGRRGGGFGAGAARARRRRGAAERRNRRRRGGRLLRGRDGRNPPSRERSARGEPGGEPRLHGVAGEVHHHRKMGSTRWTRNSTFSTRARRSGGDDGSRSAPRGVRPESTIALVATNEHDPDDLTGLEMPLGPARWQDEVAGAEAAVSGTAPTRATERGFAGTGLHGSDP